MKVVKRVMISCVVCIVLGILFIAYIEGPTRFYTVTKHITHGDTLSEDEYIAFLIESVEEKYDYFAHKDNHYVFDIKENEMPRFLDIFGVWIVMRLDVEYEAEYAKYTYYVGEPRVVYDEAVKDVDPDALTIGAWG